MKKYTAALCLLSLFLIGTTGYADSIAPNREYTASSDNRRFYITMVPSEPYEQKGSGQAFEAGKQPAAVVWEVDWFARKVFLANDGSHLVRKGPWASKLDLSDLAVAFYRNGSLLKEYAVVDLLNNPHTIMRTASHYFWLSQDRNKLFGFIEDNTTFTLTTIEEKTYLFDVETGEILQTE